MDRILHHNTVLELGWGLIAIAILAFFPLASLE